MATFTWTLDSPNGVYKNHKLSAQIREASVLQSLFHQFVDAEPGYGRNSGDTLNVTRISNITVPTSALLSEGQPMSEDAFVLSTQAIVVAENGRSIPFTSLSEDLAYFDINSKIQKMLMRQMRISFDRAVAAAFKTGQIRAACTGISSISITTNATAGTATVNPNMYHIEQIRDNMFSTYYMEPFDGEDYVCAISTTAKRTLLQDPAWIDWKKYTDPEAKYNSEIGRLENIRFVEVNDTVSLSNAKGTNSVGEAVFFGADAATMAVALDPELRAKIPTDYGRSLGVAWYGIYGFGQIWYDSANAGEARSIYLTSV
jgi:N4-gp56 family major capsid protein